MIVVDTSALMAIVLGEPERLVCMSAIEAEPDLLISGGTVAEALVVAGRRGVAAEMRELIDAVGFEVRPLMLADARQIAAAYARWSKGVHPAGLNLADCFAYALAQQQGCPLLFVGNEFARTDVRSVLAP